ncbi:AAA family ATPase [Ruminococcus sp.]|uniref:AAA family ATPase n=1 Tax=Ruminococcus sp. TaxID=41978 RepID=UPI002E805241|nr:AAA family ATPase [Ruminococcus sp.]MEE3438828.1 AAA family ATPase [Ruminococcus sp.]
MVRLIKAELQNFRGVEKGKVKFPSPLSAKIYIENVESVETIENTETNSEADINNKIDTLYNYGYTDTLGIVGPNGTGKTTLVDALLLVKDIICNNKIHYNKYDKTLSQKNESKEEPTIISCTFLVGPEINVQKELQDMKKNWTPYKETKLANYIGHLVTYSINFEDKKYSVTITDTEGKDIEDNIEDILEELKYFVRNNFHIISHSYKESIYEILQEIVFDKREKTLSQEKFIEISETISKINKVLPSIISNTKIELEQTNHTNINNSVSFITFLCENDNRIPIEYASEGSKKLIPVLHYLIQVHNNPEKCVVIDNIDRNIFGFALGEIVLAINNNGKGQFIFTSNNSNVLTKLNSKHIICTTTNPKNRYIELHQTKSEAKENLEDFYIRALMLGGQEEPLCNIYDFLGIDSAFLVSNINPAPNTEEEILKLSENLQTFLSKVKFQELSKENT